MEGGKLKEELLETIKKTVEAEFPDDPALQQIHIARKVIAKEAELKGLSFIQYVKLVNAALAKHHQQHIINEPST